MGIAKHIQRERLLHNISEKTGIDMRRSAKKQKKMPSGNPSIPLNEIEDMPTGQPEKHYQMSDDARHAVPIARYLGEHQGDPAIKVWLFFPIIPTPNLCILGLPPSVEGPSPGPYP